MIKHVPEPQFERVRYGLKGMSLWEQFHYVRKNPPRLRLTADFYIELDDGMQIVVPKKFLTDGASVPRLLWVLPGFSPFGVLLEGGIPHDFGYQHGYLLAKYDPSRTYPSKSRFLKSCYGHLFGDDLMPVFVDQSQEFFDDFFLETCKVATGARVVPGIAHRALRLWGDTAWNNYRTQGPGAYTLNSLGLPGMNHCGVVF